MAARAATWAAARAATLAFPVHFGERRTALANHVHVGALRAHVDHQTERKPPNMYINRQTRTPYDVHQYRLWRSTYDFGVSRSLWRTTNSFGERRTALAIHVQVGALRAHVDHQTERKPPNMYVNHQTRTPNDVHQYRLWRSTYDFGVRRTTYDFEPNSVRLWRSANSFGEPRSRWRSTRVRRPPN